MNNQVTAISEISENPDKQILHYILHKCLASGSSLTIKITMHESISLGNKITNYLFNKSIYFSVVKTPLQISRE